MGQPKRLVGFTRQWRLLLEFDSDPIGIRIEDAAQAHRATERTIRRDLDTLTDAGFPIEATTIGGKKRYVLRRAGWRGGEGTIFPIPS